MMYKHKIKERFITEDTYKKLSFFEKKNYIKVDTSINFKPIKKK